MIRKKLLKKAACLMAVAAVTVTGFGTVAYGYGEYQAGSTASQTDGSNEFLTWRDSVWRTAGNYDDSAKVALTPGKTEKDLNFAWYSENTSKPAVMVWKNGARSQAKVFEGTGSTVDANNWQGKNYQTSNKVSAEGYFEDNTEYEYCYTDNYNGQSTVWSAAYSYKTGNSSEYSVILTGDPQIGASGSGDDKSVTDSSVARDTYNWNKTMSMAKQVCPDAVFLLSAGDQIDKSGASNADDLKTRESEYAGYLYPEVFRSLPIASTIGNHDTAGSDYSAHFNNPNTGDSLGATNAGSDYYFSYGNVLFISLNSNNRNQAEHRELMKKAIASNENAKWKVVIFHSDIYGSGQPHADTDAATNRVIFAPLMDEFDIDVCLTGHDHTYSRSYQVLDGNVIDYDISSGSVTDPEGTLYITTGSGSGSKYYNLLNYTPYYIAERTNAMLPSFSTIDFSDSELTIKTYDYTGAKYADDFTIRKTSASLTIDEIIDNAEKLVSDGEIYTYESLDALKLSLDALKNIRKAYTTDKDNYIDTLSALYNTADDPIKGYGSVKNDDDKDVLASGSKANRLRKGLSTILDKTIYRQIEGGNVITEAILPVVNADMLNEAADKVLAGIEALKLKDTETVTTPDNNKENNDSNDSNGNNGSNDGNDSNPKAGDSSMVAVAIGGTLLVAGLAGLVIYMGRKESNWEK